VGKRVKGLSLLGLFLKQYVIINYSLARQRSAGIIIIHSGTTQYIDELSKCYRTKAILILDLLILLVGYIALDTLLLLNLSTNITSSA